MDVKIRGHRVRMTSELMEHAERRIHFAFGRFAPRLRRIVLRLTDTNGPKGGVDKACLVEAHLQPYGMVVVEQRDHDLFSAIAHGVERAGRTVARLVEREPRGATRRRPALGATG